MFEYAWQIYPRKISKKAALKAYTATLNKGYEESELLSATINYAKSREGEPDKFTLHGATFYGASERWKDYLEVEADPDDWMRM